MLSFVYPVVLPVPGDCFFLRLNVETLKFLRFYYVGEDGTILGLNFFKLNMDPLKD